MTQEDKDLLLKDLCSRLPYGVILNCCNIVGEKLTAIDENGLINHDYDIDEVKPYLFPLSSMTEEQKKYITDRWGINEDFDFEINPDWGEYFVDLGDVVDYVNWLIANHFDYRNLINKNLAIDCTNLNIY